METLRQAQSHYDVSAVTEQLFVGSLPHDESVEAIRALCIDLVVSMVHAAPPRALMEPPFRLLVLESYDFPLTPIPLRKLRCGVDAAVPVLDAGGRVLVYCRQGRHRSVTMACAILIAQGMSATQAMDVVAARRPVADPHAFYVENRIRLFERDWGRRQRLESRYVPPRA